MMQSRKRAAQKFRRVGFRVSAFRGLRFEGSGLVMRSWSCDTSIDMARVPVTRPFCSNSAVDISQIVCCSCKQVGVSHCWVIVGSN